MSGANLPRLYVEGPDDISAVSALLKVHGVDTERGERHLNIHGRFGGVEQLLSRMPAVAESCNRHPTGLMLDIDSTVPQRWDAVAGALARAAHSGHPSRWPERDGALQQGIRFELSYKGARLGHPFGVWLMHDCRTQGAKLENLMQDLIEPADSPMWDYAQSCTEGAGRIDSGGETRFSAPDAIKAEIRAWAAWQREPGMLYGPIIERHYQPGSLGYVTAFLRWLRDLYDLPINHID